MKLQRCKYSWKNIWSTFLEIIGVYLSVSSIAFCFIDLHSILLEKFDCNSTQLIILQILLVATFFVISFVWVVFMRKATLEVNGNKVEIRSGDIFDQMGIKVIGFNEFFDTTVDDKIISKNSLNGQLLTRLTDDEFNEFRNELDKKLKQVETLDKDLRVRQCGLNGNSYPLGTVIPMEDYFLVALTKFDENNNARLTVRQYFDCLDEFWKQLNIKYNGNDIVIPLLGSGITRFDNCKRLTNQDLITLMVESLYFSDYKFSKDVKITILLTEDALLDVNLFEINQKFK